MTPTQFVSGRERINVAPWHASRTIAYLSIPQNAPRPGEQTIAACRDQLLRKGVEVMYTAALREFEAHAFLGAGFEVHESLHVLEHTLRSLPTVDSPVKLRRARRHDLSSVLSVDHQAFEPFWQLDEAGIREAIAATPSARYRVADNGAVVGYAICGRADSVGFIQRLAVHPQVLRSGIGSALIVDALRWLKRRGVRQALVNTQPGNSPALSLYQRLGFTLREEPLLVLTWHR